MVVVNHHLLSGFQKFCALSRFFFFHSILLLFFLSGDGWVGGCLCHCMNIVYIYISDRDTDLVG